jgi:hypothetical protein
LNDSELPESPTTIAPAAAAASKQVAEKYRQVRTPRAFGSIRLCIFELLSWLSCASAV